jgi:hypothetical protein
VPQATTSITTVPATSDEIRRFTCVLRQMRDQRSHSPGRRALPVGGDATERSKSVPSFGAFPRTGRDVGPDAADVGSQWRTGAHCAAGVLSPSRR